MGLFALILFVFVAGADPPPLSNGLTYQEFRRVYALSARKVDLFAAIWEQDPDAIMYAGSARDFAYYILRQLLSAPERHRLGLVIEGLERRTTIEARDFIMRESDADVVATRGLSINPNEFAVRKIDYIDGSRLSPDSVKGRTEIDQGYIPVEKIALTRNGPKSLPQFGDGLAEIFAGHLTIKLSPPEVFYRTHYAQLFINHPILLTLRFLRLLAADEFNRYGKGFPRRTVDQLISEDDQKSFRKIIDGVLNSRELDPYLEKEQFGRWLNDTIRKAYRSYSNATLANQLMLHFKVNELPQRYGKIRFVNNLLFARNWDDEQIAANLKKYNVDPKLFYRKLEDAFPGRNAYHGARNERIHNAMIYQGVIPSGGGSAGPGQYVWNEPYKENASSWAMSGKYVVVETLKPATRVVSIRSGLGLEILSKFKGNLEEMVDAFGIDVIEYPYSPQAFVIKNSDMIESVQGLFYSVLTYEKAMELIVNVDNETKLRGALKQIAASRLSYPEKQMVLKRLPLKIYSDDVINLRWMEGMDSGSALLLMEAVVDRFQLPRLFAEAKLRLNHKVFMEVLGFSGSVINRNNLSADLLVELLKTFGSAEELRTILPVVMRRLDEKEISAFITSLLNLPLNEERRTGLKQALISIQSLDFDVPWSPELLKGTLLEDLRHFAGPEKLWLAHSFLKSGVQSDWAYAALKDEMHDLTVVRDRVDVVVRDSNGVVTDLRFMTAHERAENLEGFKQITKIFQGYAQDPDLLRSVLNLLPLLKQPEFALEQLGHMPLHAFTNTLDESRRALFADYLAVLTHESTAPIDTNINHRRVTDNLGVILEKDADLIIEASANEDLRKWITPAKLIAARVSPTSAVTLRTLLKESPSPITRLFAANTLFTSQIDSEFALGELVKVIPSLAIKRDGLRYRKQLILSFELYVTLIREVFYAADRSNQISLSGIEALGRLKALPTELEDSELDTEFEALKVIVTLKRFGEDTAGIVTYLKQTITNPAQPRSARMATSKALQVSNKLTPELSQALAYELHMAEYRTRRRRFKILRAPYNRDLFFSANDHLNFHLFRVLRIEDPEFDQYLLDQTREGAVTSLSPVQIVGTLHDLRVKKEAYLPFITRYLAKTGAKNMPLFFTTLVQNYPGHIAEILEAVFVVRNIPEMFTSYAQTLVRHAVNQPDFLDRLELARKQRLVPPRRQVSVEGMYLDDWLRSERDRTCAESLTVAR